MYFLRERNLVNTWVKIFRIIPVESQPQNAEFSRLL